MLPEERRRRILEILTEKQFVSVNELYDSLRVSRETIRRDINRLALENRLIKTHGGAQSMARVEPAFAERMDANIKAKRAIGRQAAKLVVDGATVIIDSGTTCLCAAESMTERNNLTVITNDIHVAGQLADRNGNRVLLLGGEVVGGEGATMGRDTSSMLENYFADISFIGLSAISEDGVLSDYTREAAALRATMIAQARIPVLIGDHDKFGWRASARVEGLERVRHLITDRKPAMGITAVLKSLKIEIGIAKT